MLLVKKPAKNIVLTAHKRNLVQKSKINTKNVIKTALKLKLPNLSKPRGSVHCLSFLKKRLQIVKWTFEKVFSINFSKSDLLT